MRQKLGKPDFEYEIACSQLCGLAHYRMKAFYTIQTPDAFQAWLDEEAAALQPQ